MAIVLKSKCEAQKGTCERPEFPSWAWRFNRNQHMTHYHPWQLREERKPPHYRNMGMHWDFRFHPNQATNGKQPMIQLGVNFCHDLVTNREAGFGNSALGRTPGPAPPRLLAYNPPGEFLMDDFYTVNEIYPISTGMSLHNNQPLFHKMRDEHSQPLTPSHYLEKTAGQIVDYPGTFPHFSKPLPTTTLQPPRICNMDDHKGCGESADLMARWRARQMEQFQRQVRERCCLDEPPYFPYTDNAQGKPKYGVGLRKCVTARR